MSTTEQTKHPTCEDRIDEHMASRLADFAPDWSQATAARCKEYLDEEAGPDSYPDESNPWNLDRAEVCEELRELGRTGITPAGKEGDEYHEVKRRDLFALIDAGDWGDVDDWREAAREHWQDHIHERLLSVDKTTVYRVCMSYGGPADYFALEFDSDGDCIGGEYLFQDWFDGARRRLTAEQAQQLADNLAVGPMYE